MPPADSLPLPPSIAAALDRLGWPGDDPLVREGVPTVARGHNLVALVPPGPVYGTPALAALLGRLGEGRRALLLAPAAQLAEWAGIAHQLAAESGLRLQAAQGTARATRRLKGAGLDLLIATPETALALHRRSALDMDALVGVLLAWPESWDDEASLAPLMQDLSKEAQRIVLTAAPDGAAELVERYARRALTLGATAGVEAAGPVHTASVAWERRGAALADLVELLDPASLVVWTADRGRHAEIGRYIAAGDPEVRIVTGDAPSAALVIAFDPPRPERLRQLLSAGGDVVLLAPPDTAGYVERIAAPRRPVRLPGMFDATTTEAAARRAAVVRALETGRPDRALLTLGPLFERYDPAAVAAALFELWTTAGAGAPAPLPDIPATARVYVGVGKKDGATANDLVAVLTKEVRYERQKIGRVELRDAFTLVEIPAQDAERVAAALNGLSIRRKRVSARVDRGGARTAPPGRPARRPTR
ncbi:MAG TPA: DbpA RNA binding domain-containing protein [Gemmatimonadales bacterium]|nr:DbpA RNA binding domain-containing protein [Gemmatimonadales bacterium]